MKAQVVLGLTGRNGFLRGPLATAGLYILASALLAAPAMATTIINGSFESVGGASASYEIDQSNLPGWTNGSSTPELLNCVVLSTDISDPCGLASSNSGDVFWTNPTVSPDGGNFIAIDADPSFSDAIDQMLSGLVVGDIYVVDFYQGAAQFRAVSGMTTDYWAVTLGSQSEDSDIMQDNTKSVVPWEAQSLQFTATSPIELLSFLAVGTPTGAPPTALLDGVSITDISSQAPEPALWALVAFALLGVIVVSRRQYKRS